MHMDLDTIRGAIARWNHNRYDEEKMLSYFSQGSCYLYEKPTDAAGSDYIHAYAGADKGKFYFFLIPEEFDNEAYEDELIDHITVCHVIPNPLQSHEIDEKEAWERIDLWEDNYEAWVHNQIEFNPNGIYRAFAIPTDDFNSEECLVYLALKANGEQTLAYDADLVITNRDGKNVKYDDFVKSVPPYGTGAVAEGNFYLMKPV